MHEVPVKITNIVEGELDNSQNVDMNAWLLVKRFFVADTIGGINSIGGWKNGAPPVVIRYASSIKLKI
jgi:hypothetical protein